MSPEDSVLHIAPATISSLCTASDASCVAYRAKSGDPSLSEDLLSQIPTACLLSNTTAIELQYFCMLSCQLRQDLCFCTSGFSLEFSQSLNSFGGPLAVSSAVSSNAPNEAERSLRWPGLSMPGMPTGA